MILMQVHLRKLVTILPASTKESLPFKGIETTVSTFLETAQYQARNQRSISFATMLPQQPKNFRFPSRRIYRRRNASWYRLRSELERYLIAFESLTFVLD
ncbi:unnamed protein product [Brugia pahangi]|uniref:PX domain-containing protein n=1 Tax=Brugia pahangi TaxID=6280 RepID=A0A0N4TV75_BRUPA|nr:unnamed protein product [Brugia pahangi]